MTPEQHIARLKKRGAHPCRIKDWENEHLRRDRLQLRREKKEARKRKASGHGTTNRRVIVDKTHEGGVRLARQWQYHATKGYRSYRQ